VVSPRPFGGGQVEEVSVAGRVMVQRGSDAGGVSESCGWFWSTVGFGAAEVLALFFFFVVPLSGRQARTGMVRTHGISSNAMKNVLVDLFTVGFE
jgi:hypothetical protein